VVCVDETWRDAVCCAEIFGVGRVEGEGGVDGAAVCVAAVLADAADAEECPSRGVGCVGDAGGVGLEEVDEV